MINPQPVTLEGHGIRLEPLTLAHHDALEAVAAADQRVAIGRRRRLRG
jgi:hypothetical protein